MARRVGPLVAFVFVDEIQSVSSQHDPALPPPVALIPHVGAGKDALTCLEQGDVSGAAEHFLDAAVKAGVVGFERQQVMRSGEAQLLGDLLLAAHRIEAHDVAFEIEQVEQLR